MSLRTSLRLAARGAAALGAALSLSAPLWLPAPPASCEATVLTTQAAAAASRQFVHDALSSTPSSSSAASSSSSSSSSAAAAAASEIAGDGAAERVAMRQRQLDNLLLFGGSSSEALAEEMAYELGRPLGKLAVSRFADGEVNVHVTENVRGKDVYIVQSTSQPVNENVMELCLLISTMRRASARTITAVIPYYGYKRDVGTVSSLTHALTHQVSQGAALAAGEASPLSLTAAPLSAPLLSLSSPSALSERRAGRASSSAAARGGGDDEGISSNEGDGDGDGDVAQASTLALFPDRNVVNVAALQGVDSGQHYSAIPVSAADVARMLETVGVDRILSVELQPPGQGQIEGFFSSNVPVESLRAAGIAVEHLLRLKLHDPVVVAPNEACIQLARVFHLRPCAFITLPDVPDHSLPILLSFLLVV